MATTTTKQNNKATTTTKQNNKKTEKTEKTEKEKVVKTDYLESAPSEEINADGKLTTATPGDFDDSVHKPLRKGDFATEDLYFRWKSVQLRQRGEEMIKRADALDQQAEEIAKFGDPATRAKVRKLQKLREAQAELEKKLKEEGVEV